MGELTKPEIDVPEGDAPTELTIRDLVVGDGAEAKPGRVVQVHYVGVTFESGKEFDASWDRGQPFKFAVGGGRVIKGWDRGIRGMKVGGRREIVVPRTSATARSLLAVDPRGFDARLRGGPAHGRGLRRARCSPPSRASSGAGARSRRRRPTRSALSTPRVAVKVYV